MSSEHDVTLLLNRWAQGDETALDRLIPLLYRELHKIAKRYMQQQAPGHTLQTTAVIHEAYLKLAGDAERDWKDRSHFLAVAAKAMRQVLVDYARSQKAAKRGGEFAIVPLEDGLTAARDSAAEVVALDAGIEALAKVDPRKAQVIELRYFGGLSVEETARALDISAETVARDWKFARAFLRREMQRGA
jgi:RNA polymerase sigma factor (TIGR02999 family)